MDQKDMDRMANSADRDQTGPFLFPNTLVHYGATVLQYQLPVLQK